MKGLGRLFNVIPTADTVRINLEDAAAVTFVCTGDEAYTLQEAQTLAGAGQDLDVVDRFYKGAAVGVGTWTLVEQTADAVVDPNGVAVAIFTVDAVSLSDGYKYVDVTAASTGLVTAIVHDLVVQRDPANLPALSV
jgi:hypothetical protein